MKKIVIFSACIVLLTISFFTFCNNKDVRVIVTTKYGMTDTAFMDQSLLEKVAPGQTVCITATRKLGKSETPWRIEDGMSIKNDTIIDEEIHNNISYSFILKRNVVIDKILTENF